jgi:ElaB/YqjD/DUF883 family membrane-anchored ribosome-binding protein
MTSSAFLQHEAEQSRAQLSTTLDELRMSMTRTALTSGATALAKESGATVARAVVRRASANPLATVLIGAGVALLCSPALGRTIGASLRVGANARSETSHRDASGAVAATTNAVSDAADKAAGTVRDAAAAAAETASGTLQRAGEMVSQSREQIAATTERVQERAAQSGERFMQFVQEQPGVAVALAVAAGAVLGATLPVTEAERRYLGSAATRVTEKGRRVATNVAESVVPQAATAATEALSSELRNGEATTR